MLHVRRLKTKSGRVHLHDSYIHPSSIQSRVFGWLFKTNVLLWSCANLLGERWARDRRGESCRNLASKTFAPAPFRRVMSNPVDRALKFVASREFLFGCFFLFLLNAAWSHVSDVDVGFHIRTGELVLQTHSIPSTNTFSYTFPDHPWLLHQWLPTILIYAINQLGGYHAIIIATV